MRKKTLPLFLTFLILLTIVVIAIIFTHHYIWAGGKFFLRSSPSIDLRGRAISVSDYEQLQEEIPGCDIIWDVPFQGKLILSSTESIQVTALTKTDVHQLRYFPDLVQLDASSCVDYPELVLAKQQYPQCDISYKVTIGGVEYPDDIMSVSVVDPSSQELAEKLSFLTEVEQVNLSGKLPDIADLEELQRTFPEIDFHWEVQLQNITVDNSTEELDLSGNLIAYDLADEILSLLPNLKYVNMTECGLSDDEMIALATEYRQCFFLWNMRIGNTQVPTNAEEIDISGQKMESPEEIESLLPFFPNVKRVIMSFCGLDDVTMDALNKRYDDIRFIWSVQIGNVFVRTDEVYFYPFKFYREMTVDSEDLYALRYCTDMVCIDIGHMWEVDNCEWAAFMPELKYLIIVETEITDLTPLSNCKKLVYLEIFTTPVTDYSPLVECTSLEDLNLGRTYGDPAPIAKMTWLKNLWWCDSATRGRPCSHAKDLLKEALPNTTLRFYPKHPTADGWRKLDNYFAMRDFMDMFYLP